MKKSLISILALLLMASCQINELATEYATVDDDLYASIESVNDTKTVMDENNNVLWSEDDQLVAFMGTTLGVKYQIKEQFVGTSTGEFSKIDEPDNEDELVAGHEIDHNVVLYPHSYDVWCMKNDMNTPTQSYKLNVVLPEIQNYEEDSFGLGSFPMIAVAADKKLTFKNICGGLKLQFKGVDKIKSIKLEGLGNEKISGKSSVVGYVDGSAPTITMANDDKSFNSVTLDCGEGVQLSETTPTTFIIAVPPVEFASGMKITVTDTGGYSKTLTNSSSNTIKRSSLLTFPVITYKQESSESQFVLCLTYETTSANQIVYLTHDVLQCAVAGLDNELVNIDYGDGEFGTSLSHTYSEAGIYEVQMTFKNPINEIGANAFYECAELVGIQLPESLTKIGEYAFGKSGLRGNLVIPENNVQIGSAAFLLTGEYENFIVPFGTDFTGGTAHFYKICAKNLYMGANIPNGIIFWYSAGIFEGARIENMIIGNQVTIIGNFSIGCNNPNYIKNIEFEEPSSLKYLGDAALVNNAELVSIDLPRGIEYISTYCVFDLCPKLEAINMSSRNYWSEDGVLYSFSSEGGIKSVFRYPEAKTGELFEDKSVGCIAPSAFRDNKHLKKVSVNLFNGIGDVAFMGCTNLTEIEGCDYSMGDAYSYEIYIGESAFRECTSLKEFTIGLGVDVIKSSAFYGCISLERIYLKSSIPPVLEDNDEDLPTFANNAPERLICVPLESVELYKEAPVWNAYEHAIVGYTEVDGEIVLADA